MNILCLCPTYGRPRHILENTIACFESQDHPAENRRLMIFDDGGNVAPQDGESWRVFSSPTRLPSLPGKYNAMLRMANSWFQKWDAVCVWDDDDVYLPHHVSASAAAMKSSKWSHPNQVLSTYAVEPGDPLRIEGANGRFHGSLSIRRDLLGEIGGWIRTKRADFDQQQIAICHKLAGDPGRPDETQPPSYVFRWGDTGATHCQGLMSSAENEDWYARNAKGGLPEILRLDPAFDDSTAKIIAGEM